MVYSYDDINPDDYIKSKSQAKREMTALQELGENLVNLNDNQLAQMPLEANLLEAIHEVRKMPHREARRRHLQFIGKLMRTADHDAIQKAYDQIQDKSHKFIHRQHRAERYRDQLLSGDAKVLQDFIQLYQGLDVQYLRQVIRSAQKEIEENKPPASARKLFRFILERMDAHDS